MSHMCRGLVMVAVLFAAYSSPIQACHHHRRASMAYVVPEPVFVPAPVMLYDTPAPSVYYAPLYSAPTTFSAPVVETAPVVAEMAGEVTVEVEAEVEVGADEPMVTETAPIVESAPMVESTPIHQGPVAPATYFYSLEPPLTQQPYAFTPAPVAPPIVEMVAPPIQTIVVPFAPAPRRTCPLGGCH